MTTTPSKASLPPPPSSPHPKASPSSPDPSSPSPSPPRALIFMVHGYDNDISWTFQSTLIFLASSGFASFALDLQGHGRSQGLKAFIPSVDLVVQDCLSFFNSVKSDPNFRGLLCVLYDESMGGAICLLIHLADPTRFQGAVLVAPMCRISEKVRPKWPIPQILTFLTRFLLTWAIVLAPDLMYNPVKVDLNLPPVAAHPAPHPRHSANTNSRREWRRRFRDASSAVARSGEERGWGR